MKRDLCAPSAELLCEAAQILSRAARGGFADVFYEESTTSSVLFEDSTVEAAAQNAESGVGLRIYRRGRTVSASLACPDGPSILALARELAPQKGHTIRPGCGAEPSDHSSFEPLSGHTLKQKAALCAEIDRAVRGLDPRIIQVRIAYRDDRRRISVASETAGYVEDLQTGLYFSILVTAAEGTLTQTGYEALGGSGSIELFKERQPLAAALEAGKRALAMLGARYSPGGPMAVVLAAEAGGTMVHEAVGHGLEADLVEGGHSIYKKKLGKRIASSKISVADDPTLVGRRGSYAFDDEGLPARRKILVEQGILTGWLHSRETAHKTGEAPTGNGRRESFRDPPIPRMSNTLILSGADDPARIVRDTHRGLYVTRMGGGQVDTVSGDFVFEVAEGFLIENGAVGAPVRGATLTGNGIDVLLSVDMVGNDLGFGLGTCGKDGQEAPVADAQPTLRIPTMVVGGR